METQNTYKPLEASAILKLNNEKMNAVINNKMSMSSALADGLILVIDGSDNSRISELHIRKNSDKDGYEVAKLSAWNSTNLKAKFDIEGYNFMNAGKMAHLIENLIDGRKTEVTLNW